MGAFAICAIVSDAILREPFSAATLNNLIAIATLLFAMGKPAASRMLKHFSPEELRVVTKSAATLGAVSPAAVEALVEEFASNFSMGADLVGTASEIERLLQILKNFIDT